MLEATGIHQVLAWDITLLPGPMKGQFYYLYMVMDVWSQRSLGVAVHGRECSELASAFFDRICRDEGISKETAAIFYSDNGAAMRSVRLAAEWSSWVSDCHFLALGSNMTMPMQNPGSAQ